MNIGMIGVAASGVKPYYCFTHHNVFYFPSRHAAGPLKSEATANQELTYGVVVNPQIARHNELMSRIVLAMSGGVDSSVAACLLREAGHDVIGLFMRHGHKEATTCSTSAAGNPRKQGCCTASDAADARKVAERLGIPFYAINFEEEFGRIIHYFIREYTSGRTPNPCVVCNTWLKFGKLLDYADSVGAAEVATGHYARLIKSADGRTTLCRGLDPGKDQSYVLWGIRPEVLARLRFPVGDYCKEEIRRIADRLGLHHVAEKPDSQEICFVPDQDHARFIRENRTPQNTSGAIVTTDGREVGRHEGVEQFTIGQRKGLGIAFGEPRYVVRIDAQSREVVVGTKDELARHDLTARGANWFVPPDGRLECQVKIRYRTAAVPAIVEPLSDDHFRATFLEPCYGIAPGQAAVCYRGDELLGGGWID
jgi:tRNA-specific 2-thiouridylase